MRHKEQRLWDRMRNARPRDVRLERVENMLDEGFPDVLVKPRGVGAIACELKAVHSLPKRSTSQVFGTEGLTTGQRNWLLDWGAFDGRSIILASCGEGAAAQHWAVPGALADAFNGMSALELAMNSVTTAPRGREFWAQFYEYLRGMTQ